MPAGCGDGVDTCGTGKSTVLFEIAWAAGMGVAEFGPPVCAVAAGPAIVGTGGRFLPAVDDGICGAKTGAAGELAVLATATPATEGVLAVPVLPSAFGSEIFPADGIFSADGLSETCDAGATV